MDDIIRNVKGDPGVVIKAANNLHPNLQFTIEELDSKGNDRVFRSTSTWENFDRALEKNRKQWIENQYPKNWSDRVVFETLNKIIEGKKNSEVTASDSRNG